MKESSNENKRNEIMGLGKHSSRKNYYRSLIEKQKDLEAKNLELSIEILRRKEAEKEIQALNDELEERIISRTLELAESNTQLKKTLTNLEKSYSYLIEAEKLASLNHLVNGISHELNTPLGVSLTSASFINDIIAIASNKFSEKKLTRTDLENMFGQLNETSLMLLDSIDKMTRLTENFKRIALVQDNYQKFEFSVYEYTDMIIESMQSQFNDFDQVTVNNKCDPNLVIESYPGIYSQLLTTFINNSLVHGFNKIGGHISITVSEESSHYHIIYQDDGKGIDKLLISHVFEPFFSTKMNNETPGLGLFAVYNLITSLNGTITCDSELGHGFVLDIKLPKQHQIKNKKDIQI